MENLMFSQYVRLEFKTESNGGDCTTWKGMTLEIRRKDREEMREEGNLPQSENPNINPATGKSNYLSFICQRQFV